QRSVSLLGIARQAHGADRPLRWRRRHGHVHGVHPARAVDRLHQEPLPGLMRNLILILAGAVLLFCAGCRAPQDGKARVRVIFWGSPEEVQIITDTISIWEKQHPDILVILEHGHYDSYTEKILTQV